MLPLANFVLLYRFWIRQKIENPKRRDTVQRLQRDAKNGKLGGPFIGNENGT